MGGPNPEKVWHPRVGARKGGGWPNISRIFPSPAPFSLFFSSLGVFSWKCGRDPWPQFHEKTFSREKKKADVGRERKRANIGGPGEGVRGREGPEKSDFVAPFFFFSFSLSLSFALCRSLFRSLSLSLCLSSLSLLPSFFVPCFLVSSFFFSFFPFHCFSTFFSIFPFSFFFFFPFFFSCFFFSLFLQTVNGVYGVFLPYC